MWVIKLADLLSVVIIMGQKLAYCEMLLCTIWNNFHREQIKGYSPVVWPSQLVRLSGLLLLELAGLVSV